MITFEEAETIAANVARGVRLLRSCIEADEVQKLKEYFEDDIKPETAQRLDAVEVIMQWTKI